MKTRYYTILALGGVTVASPRRGGNDELSVGNSAPRLQAGARRVSGRLPSFHGLLEIVQRCL
jgi:hypothetical protein